MRPPAGAFEEALKKLRAGDFSEASALCRTMLARAPDDPAIRQLAAAVALAAGDGLKAFAEAKASLDRRPDHGPTLLIAGRAAPSPAEAIACFRRAGALDPKKPEPAFLLCVALLEAGDAEAQTLLPRLIEQFPNDAPGWSMLAGALEKRGHLGAAVVALQRAARAAPSASLFLRLGTLLRLNGRPSEAPKAFAAALDCEPAHRDAALKLGLAHREAGDRLAARAALETAVRLAPERSEAWFALGLVTQDLRDFPAAVDAYRRALAEKPDMAEAAANLGIVLQETGDLRAARNAYGEAIKLRPDTFGRIAQALSAAPKGEIWLDLDALRASLAG